MSILDYFLKANLYSLLFVGCYWLLLRQHTFFSLNRVYLLMSALISLVLPLVSLPTQTLDTLPEQVPVGVIVLPATVVESSALTTETYFLISYGIIAGVLLIRFLFQTLRLRTLIRRAPQHHYDDYVLIQPNNSSVPTFSFFRYVVLNPADSENALILQHELVHVRQKHSADVLLVNVLQAVFWGCPMLWLTERLLRQVHEFLADSPASQPIEYARFLVSYSLGLQPAVHNSNVLGNRFFNPSLLKQRISMLCSKPTTRWALGKYALILPLAFGLLAMTTAREKITTVLEQIADERITVSGSVTSKDDGKPLPGVSIVVKNQTKGTTTDADGNYKLTNVTKTDALVFSFVGFKTQVVPVNGQSTINVRLVAGSSELNEVHVVAYEPSAKSSKNEEVFRVVEQQPEFPGGMHALGQYLAQNLRYPKEARQNRIQGKVFVQFVVSSTGAVHDLRVLKGIGGGCDEEAVRVVSQMPTWKPARQQGKAVNVIYNLPINFALEKGSDIRTGQTILNNDTGQPVNHVIDNSKNIRFSPYNDVKDPFIALPDSSRTGTTIHFREYSSLTGHSPLYILDDVEISDEQLKGLNPNSIASINVLKGTSATVEYGEKGKNGVIIITSRKK